MSLAAFRRSAVGAASLFVVVVAFSKAPFARYLADDFGFAVGYVEHGFFGFQRHFYATISGRFTATALEMVVSAAGRSAVPWLVVFGLIALAIAVVQAAHAVLHAFDPNVERRTAALVALLVLAALLDSAPAFYQSLIWIAGYLIYGLPVALIAVVATNIAKGAAEEERNTRRMGVIAVLSFIAAGCSETTAVCQVAGFGALVLVTRGRVQRLAVAALAGSLTGFGIVALSPGNAARRVLLTQFLTPRPLPQAIVMMLGQLVPRVTSIIRDAAPYLVMLVAVLLPRDAERTARFDRIRLTRIAQSLAVIASVVAAALLVGLWSLGSAPPPRAMFVTHAWVLAALVVATLVVIDTLPYSKLIDWTLTLATVVVIALGPLRYADQRVRSIATARNFSVATDAVDRFARTHPGADLFVSLPRIFEGLDVTSRNPQAWTNTLMARYYGVHTIAWRDMNVHSKLATPPGTR